MYSLNMLVQLSLLPKVVTTPVVTYDSCQLFHRLEGYAFAVTSPRLGSHNGVYAEAAMHGNFVPIPQQLYDFFEDEDWYRIGSTSSLMLPYKRGCMKREELLIRIFDSIASHALSFPEDFDDPIKPQSQDACIAGYMSVDNPNFEMERLRDPRAKERQVVLEQRTLLSPQRVRDRIEAFKQGREVLFNGCDAV